MTIRNSVGRFKIGLLPEPDFAIVFDPVKKITDSVRGKAGEKELPLSSSSMNSITTKVTDLYFQKEV